MPRDTRPDAARRSCCGGNAGKAIGDPTPLLIALARREGQEVCVCDLGWIAGRAENVVGHVLRAQRAVGLAWSPRDYKLVSYALTSAGREFLDAHVGLAEQPPSDFVVG